MVRYLASIWRLRYFWSSLVRIDLRNRYRRSVLGIGWSLLHPILMTAVLCAVFCPILRVDYRSFAPYLLAGLAFWNFLVSTASQGCHCFLQAESYIRQQAAPLAIYPLRTVLGTAIHGLAALLVVLIFTGLVQGFSSFTAVLSLVPSLAIILLLGWAVAACCGMLNVVFQDTHHLIEVLFQILFYLTPVMYPAKMLSERQMGWLVEWNPLAAFLELVRAPILDGQVPSPHAYGLAMAVVTLLMVAAGCVLARLER